MFSASYESKESSSCRTGFSLPLLCACGQTIESCASTSFHRRSLFPLRTYRVLFSPFFSLFFFADAPRSVFFCLLIHPSFFFFTILTSLLPLSPFSLHCEGSANVLSTAAACLIFLPAINPFSFFLCLFFSNIQNCAVHLLWLLLETEEGNRWKTASLLPLLVKTNTLARERAQHR